MHTVKFNNPQNQGEVKFPFITICGVSSESLPQQLANNTDITKEGSKLHVHTKCLQVLWKCRSYIIAT
jgi:hypothetical protein